MPSSSVPNTMAVLGHSSPNSSLTKPPARVRKTKGSSSAEKGQAKVNRLLKW